ncbi:universal stress protein [Streptomyces sp. P9-A4]|uniref:universal stress protein n=1 Tax=Streptomyces sp. P9-A4 TaxID=3072285 RepID=UPI002FCB4890
MDGTPACPGPSRVVVGVDGASSARTAVMRAASEAALRGSTLFLVHAAGTDAQAPFLSRAEIARNRQAGRELLDRTAEAITARHPGLTVVTELTDGGAADGLRGAAALTGTIGVGHLGLGGFPSLSLGSVGLQAAAGASTPVAMVRGTAEPVDACVVLAAVRDEADVGCARAAAREACCARYLVGGRLSPGYLGPALGRTALSPLQHAHCPEELVPRQGPGHGSTS